MATPPVITCKAAVIRKLGEPLQVEEIQVDPPKSTEVRIKMLCASMCHTDILCCKGFPAAVKGAQIQGASRIIGIDINEFKEEKAKAFGITEFINPKLSDKSVSELIKEATGGLGVDYCFECTGVPSLLNEAIDGSKLGLGTVVLISAGVEPSGELNYLPLLCGRTVRGSIYGGVRAQSDLPKIVEKCVNKGLGTIVFIGAGLEKSGELNYIPLLCGRTVRGSIYGGVRTQSDLPKIVEKCVNKEIDLDELITHEVSLAEINKGFEYMKQPSSVKVVIKF
ncbi:UNVERIFIED_CONTAM: 8-hydroxygeraniol oxidoreductase [Sesamum radiatum]|uniref:8-hydroxygeraniol oxidoreductase n=1 Tax=Sesamum radiatum TaxID=300843 RepID=A0AAW2MFI4_SESRA